MNPHQVDAALFALASPPSKGVVLADEVGLGKANLFLRKRLESISKRTLRRQVQQAGLILYTERRPLTLQFEPSDYEVELYITVSAHLQRPSPSAIPAAAQ